MRLKLQTLFFTAVTILLVVIVAWSIVFQASEADPEIEQKYAIASKDLQHIKNIVIAFYCRNKKFPAGLDALETETTTTLPRDPWGHKYILTSLAWRLPESGRDLVSMGGDGKRGGKAWKRDIISRIDITDIHCEEKK